jgi:hypothetical protein
MAERSKLVTVVGIEQFVGLRKVRYRSAIVSQDPDAHHDAFAAQLPGWSEVERGRERDQSDVVARLEADDRWLVADFIELPDGGFSYRVWERPPQRASEST